MARINENLLILELKSSEKILVKEATKVVEKKYFLPAVEDLKNDFLNHNVTQEILGGTSAKNISNTLGGPNNQSSEPNSSEKNLYNFIGFDETDDDGPISAIVDILDPSHPNGPKMKYVKGSQKNNLEFTFEITPPKKDAIFASTPMPWAPGISWAQRIEQGIPGLGYFLNKFGKKGSRSGGGIQVKSQLRSGGYKPVKYISDLLNRFIKNIKNR